MQFVSANGTIPDYREVARQNYNRNEHMTIKRQMQINKRKNIKVTLLLLFFSFCALIFHVPRNIVEVVA